MPRCIGKLQNLTSESVADIPEATSPRRHRLASEQSKHVAPNWSPEHLRLRDAARRAGHDEETLRDILWLINAHDRLFGLRRVATNLLGIIESKARDHENLVFEEWPEVLRWIAKSYLEPGALRAGTSARGPSGAESSEDASAKDPVRHRGIGRHPLYDCLWQRSKKWAIHYRGLQWHLLRAHVSYLLTNTRRDEYENYGDSPEWKAFPNSPYAATLSLRELAKHDWGPILPRLRVSSSARAFSGILGKVECPDGVPKSLVSKWRTRRSDLRSFIAKANGWKEWVHRAGGQGNFASRYPDRDLSTPDAMPGDPDDLDAHWPAARWVTIPGAAHGSGSKRTYTTEELLNLDLDPDEIVELEHRYLVAPEDDDPDYQHLAMLSALGARGQLRHLQMAHQLLPWDYNHLTLHELAWCLHECSNAVREISDLAHVNEDQYLILELVTLIHVMLWTGSSLDRACDLRIIEGSTNSDVGPRFTTEVDLVFESKSNQWRIRAITPDYKSVIEDPENQAYAPADSFPLPDIAKTSAFINLLWPLSESDHVGADTDETIAAARRKEGRLFLGSETYYRTHLREWLKGRTNALTGRVTVGRIESFLFNRLLAAKGDLMAAVLITGHSHPQARTQQFYASYGVAQLQSIYIEAASAIVREAHLAADLEPPELCADTGPAPNEHVGARLCATQDAVQRAIRRLREDLDVATTINDRAQAINYHNLYTLYTLRMFAYATSVRAIRTPYIPLNRVDTDRGFAFLSDKDDDAQHKTRQTWIPPLVISQMEAYADHLHALRSDNPHLLIEINRGSTGGMDICCFLDVQGKPKEVRPKTVAEHMKPYLALPPNVHRRFMRYALLNDGCPPEVVMAWLGHAFQGEEVWGPHSTLGFVEYRDQLKAHLLPVLEELGWKLYKSPLC